jgi:hypothetical protein
MIDGLDEFDDTAPGQTYGLLMDDLLRWVRGSNGSIKMCVSSRMQAPFMSVLSNKQRIRVNRLTEGDMRLVVKRRLEQHPRFVMHKVRNPDACQQSVEDLMETADGVFLHLVLVLVSLREGLDNEVSIDNLQKVVAETPSDMNELFAHIMKKHQTQIRHGARSYSRSDAPVCGLLTLERKTVATPFRPAQF